MRYLIVLVLFTASMAHAGTILTYQGQNYSDFTTSHQFYTKDSIYAPIYHPEYTIGMALTMEIDVADILPMDGTYSTSRPNTHILSWTINDGRHTVDAFSLHDHVLCPFCEPVFTFNLSGGEIVSWDVGAIGNIGGNGYAEAFETHSSSGDQAQRSYEEVHNCSEFLDPRASGDCLVTFFETATADHGSWSMVDPPDVAAVPEPSSLILMLITLLGMFIGTVLK